MIIMSARLTVSVSTPEKGETYDAKTVDLPAIVQVSVEVNGETSIMVVNITEHGVAARRIDVQESEQT